MKIIIGFFLLALLGLGVFFVHIPDNSSLEYHAWTEKRQRDHLHQKHMEKIFLDPAFHFKELEIIEVGAGKIYYSLWGHILLRFVGSGQSPDEDLTVSFLADFNDFPVHKWKASFGGYEVLPKLDFISGYHQEYFVGEGRFMNAYPLKTTEKQREKLKAILKEWIVDRSKPATYSFFWNNCVGLMNKLMERSGILTNQMSREGFYPKDIPPMLHKYQLISPEDYTKYALK